MTDYNDGNWHGWNGGECPVHPETIVEYIWANGGQSGLSRAKACYSGDGVRPAWSGSVKAFRVIKQHREPRELWETQSAAGGWVPCRSDYPGATLFREVLE